MKVTTVEQMRNMDRRAIEEYGIPEEILMENASLAAYEVLRDRLGAIRGRRITIFCGGGNNGGDGLALARKLFSTGSAVSVYLLSDPEKYKHAARINYDILSKLPVPVKQLGKNDEVSTDTIVREIEESDAVVDALLGTGLDREVKGVYREVILAINRHAGLVISLDIPSGINGNTGQVMDVAVEADETVTFGLPKIGNLVYPGYDHCGTLSVTHISFPEELIRDETVRCEVNLPDPLPDRDPMGHKGSFGDALVIAGASSYYGAPFLSAYAFMKAGGGYARLACPGSIAPVIASLGPEIVFLPQKENTDGGIDSGNLEHLIELSESVDIVILGPGMSLSVDTRHLALELVKRIEKPLIIDGDGLSAVASSPDTVKQRTFPTILTPHPGEFSRLSGASVEEIGTSAVPLLRVWSGDFRCFTLLKRAHTLIGTPDGMVYINLGGNCGMATAGTGDVLTGTIAAAFGLGLDVPEAVKAGVFMHGCAGDLAADRKGKDGMTARDIMEALPEAVSLFREEYEVLRCGYNGRIYLI